MNFSFYLGILIAANPFNCIFLYFFDIADSLQNVSNIINSSLLNFKNVNCCVQINGHIFAIFDEIDEFLGQYW